MTTLASNGRHTIGVPDIDIEFARIIDELTRRGFLAGGAGTAALLGLAACTSDNRGGGALAPTLSRRTVKTIHGDVKVPADPRRIVALDFPEACALLDLGITPVGQPNYMPHFSAYTTALKGVPMVVDPSGKPELEKIAALKPDLIVGDDWASPAKQTVPWAELQRIAPTTVFEWQEAAGNWPELAADSANAINRAAPMAALQQRYLARAAQLKKTYADLFASTRWDLVDDDGGKLDLYGPTAAQCVTFTLAGVRLGAGKKVTTGFQQYSMEDLGLLSGSDVIVTQPGSMKLLEQEPLFTRLPAVRAGRAFTSDLFFPASYGVAIALLDDLAGICAKLKENR